MYRYKVEQGSLKAIFKLDCDSREPLLTSLAAFFYFHNASLDIPIQVYQDGLPILEEQVEEEKKKLFLFFKERGITR